MNETAQVITLACKLFGVITVKFKRAGSEYVERISVHDLLRRLDGKAQLELFKLEK